MFSTTLLLRLSVLLSSPGQPEPSACVAQGITAATVIECSQAYSPRLEADLAHIEADRGHASSARILLPSNPTVSLSLGQRSNGAGDTALNVTGTLQQRVEIGAQRRRRIDVAQRVLEGGEARYEISQREVVAEALLAYYDVLAARRELAVTQDALRTTEHLVRVAEARAHAGLGTPLETELAAAESANLRETMALAKGRVAVAEARLASHLGLNPALALPTVQGDLEPPAQLVAKLESALGQGRARAEFQEGRARKEGHEASIALLKRSRVPTPTFSLFAGTDGFGERVVGGGVSLAIPLPSPVGRTHKGQIAAEQSHVTESEQRLSQLERRVDLEVVMAYREFEAHREASGAYTVQANEAAAKALGELSAQIEAGQLPVADALMAQRTLLEMLLRSVESKHALCRSAVALAYASGSSFQGETR